MARKLFLQTADGLVEHLVPDPSERGRYAIRYRSDVTANIEENKARFNEPDRAVDGMGRKVASIPNAVAMIWLTRYGVDVFKKDHWPAVRRLLNDPEWRHLRTAPGKL
jgi:hypothetical protein